MSPAGSSSRGSGVSDAPGAGGVMIGAGFLPKSFAQKPGCFGGCGAGAGEGACGGVVSDGGMIICSHFLYKQ